MVILLIEKQEAYSFMMLMTVNEDSWWFYQLVELWTGNM